MRSIIIVIPLDDSTNHQTLARTLSKAAEHTNYYFLILPGRVDFQKVTRKQLAKMIDDIPDK